MVKSISIYLALTAMIILSANLFVIDYLLHSGGLEDAEIPMQSSTYQAHKHREILSAQTRLYGFQNAPMSIEGEWQKPAEFADNSD